MSPAPREPTHGPATADLRRPWTLIVVFLAPALLLYGLFFLYPMAKAVWLSFHHGGPASEVFEPVGLENYRRLLTDDIFRTVLWHNIQFILVSGTTTLTLALALAVGLTRIGRGRDFFRVVFLFPNVMSVVAISILWSFVLNPSFGILNALLRLVGLESLCRAWLGEPGVALWSVMGIHVWTGVGFYIILFYAGILRIPRDYLEAAEIDGAGPWQQFRHITFPLLNEILKIAVIYAMIQAVNVFALVYVLNEATPNRYNDVLLTYLYEQAFTVGHFGYACAIGVFILVFVLTLATVFNRLFRRETVEL